MDATGRIGRAKFFAEFIENANIIFSEENLNKIEAIHGKEFRIINDDTVEAVVEDPTGVVRAV